MKVLAVLLVTVVAASFPVVESQPPYVVPISTFKREARIIGGEQAYAGQFPYQVGLSISGSLGSLWCGGSLISPEWVLTAAHCTYQSDYITINIGATKRSEPKQVVTSTEFYIPESYNHELVSDDISLVKLPEKAVITDDVALVALPSSEEAYSTYEGERVVVAGWGLTSDDGHEAVEDLLYINRQVDPPSVCAGVYGTAKIKDSHICVGTKDGDTIKSTCGGDSGGPLVLDDGSRIQIGLASFGAQGGCGLGHPVVFTRLTSYAEWIKEISGVSA